MLYLRTIVAEEKYVCTETSPPPELKGARVNDVFNSGLAYCFYCHSDEKNQDSHMRCSCICSQEKKNLLSVWIMGRIKFTAITEAEGVIIFYVFYAPIQCDAVWCYSGNHVKTWSRATVYITATLSFTDITSKPSQIPSLLIFLFCQTPSKRYKNVKN